MAIFYAAQVRELSELQDMLPKDHVHEDFVIGGLYRTFEEAEAALPAMVDELLEIYDDQAGTKAEWTRTMHEGYTSGFWFESAEFGIEGRALVREVHTPD